MPGEYLRRPPQLGKGSPAPASGAFCYKIYLRKVGFKAVYTNFITVMFLKYYPVYRFILIQLIGYL